MFRFPIKDCISIVNVMYIMFISWSEASIFTEDLLSAAEFLPLEIRGARKLQVAAHAGPERVFPEKETQGRKVAISCASKENILKCRIFLQTLERKLQGKPVELQTFLWVRKSLKDKGFPQGRVPEIRLPFFPMVKGVFSRGKKYENFGKFRKFTCSGF
jgi:hypothetical protein